MGSAGLAGRLILIVEDEAFIAIDLHQTFESAGARVINAQTIRDALIIAEEADLAAAVVDYGLADGNSSELCACLRARDIPFIMYSGYSTHEVFPNALFVPKPATPGLLLSAMSQLLNLGTAVPGDAHG